MEDVKDPTSQSEELQSTEPARPGEAGPVSGDALSAQESPSPDEGPSIPHLRPASLEDRIKSYEEILNINIRFIAIFSMMVFFISLIFSYRLLKNYSAVFAQSEEAIETSLTNMVHKHPRVLELIGTRDAGKLGQEKFLASLLGPFDMVLQAHLLTMSPRSRGMEQIDLYQGSQFSQMAPAMQEKISSGNSEAIASLGLIRHEQDFITNGEFLGRVAIVFSNQRLSVLRDALWRRALWNNILVIFVALAVGFILSRLMTAPIEEIVANMGFISKKHFSSYIKTTRIGTEGRLIAAVNTLLKSFNTEFQVLEKEYQERTDHLDAMLQATMNEISEPVVIIGPDNTISTVNRPFSKLFSAAPSKALGRHFFELFESRDTVAAIRDIRLKSFENKSRTSFSFLDIPISGRVHRFRTTVKSFDMNQGGRLSMVIFKPITDEKED